MWKQSSKPWSSEMRELKAQNSKEWESSLESETQICKKKAQQHKNKAWKCENLEI